MMPLHGLHHASHQPCMRDPPALHALLPQFYEKSATPAMVKHGMDVQKQAVEYLNPGQNTEMAIWNTLGDVLEDSGWIQP